MNNTLNTFLEEARNHFIRMLSPPPLFFCLDKVNHEYDQGTTVQLYTVGVADAPQR